MGDGSHTGWALRAQAACDWVLWVLTMNALWWLFTLGGAVVFGAAPATVAAAALTRRQLRGEKIHALRDFARIWRAELLTANAVLLPLYVAGALLGAALVSSFAAGTISSPLGALQIAAAIVVIAIAHVVAPMYAHYDLPLGQYVTTAMRWAGGNLAHILVLLAGAALVVGATLALPGLLPFLTVGALIVIDTALGIAFFRANDRVLAEQT
ncbi:YesL family protein [Microbacterium sp. G2-8]|uniref:YesL family protein n=1 Tax=Microbacterium sp. G2-8 TaxID=2842454 RepID=UPI001C8AFA3E|nr:DUF624 domain-containing protein [Microbacterium sp. G2-8]